MLNLSSLQLLNTETENSSRERSFTSITVKIDNPLLIFTPRPRYKEFFTADLGEILISNSPTLSSTRHKEQTVWVDLFEINMQNINITVGDRKVVEEFNLELKVERPILSPQQANMSDIDLAYTIQGNIDKIKFNITQKDFQLLLRLSDLNLAYDDKLDEMFTHSKSVDNINSNGIFLSMKMEINMISLLLLHENH